MTGREGVWVSKKDRNRFEVIQEFLSRRMSRVEAALALNCSERNISRHAKRVSLLGIEGVFHGNRGKDAWNKSDPELLAQIKDLILGPYQNFNMRHAHEFLTEKHGIKIGYTRFRKLCHSIHAVKRPKRRAKARHYRPRHPAEGYLLQMDGSTHRWFGSVECCLIAGIDDATSDLPYGEFFKSEGLFGTMRVLRKIIEKKGIPWALYLDRANWFAGWKPSEEMQFQRICKELNIKIIPAYSPQAKGRIERTWGTLQDRLIAEMGLHQVTRLEEATEYLNKEFIPKTWQKKFTVEPQSTEYLYRPLTIHQKLDHVFCLKFKRKVRLDHTILYNNQRYDITTKLPYSIARRVIEIRVNEAGEVEGWLNERNLELKSLTKFYGNRYAG